MSKNKTSQKLKNIMKEKGINQTELCKRTGLPKSTISQYVNGKRIPNQESLFLISQALDIPVTSIMEYDFPIFEITLPSNKKSIKINLEKEKSAKMLNIIDVLLNKLSENQIDKTMGYLDCLLQENNKEQT